MFRAHELMAVLRKDSQEYRDCVEAVKFDLGEAKSVSNMADIATGEFFDIPAPICLFQVVFDDGNPVFFLAKKSDDYKLTDPNGNTHEKTILWRSFGKGEIGKWGIGDLMMVISPKTVDCDKKKLFCGFAWSFTKKKEIVPQEMNDLELSGYTDILVTAKAIEAFSCSNVVSIKHSAPKLINEKRKKKGKVPFFSYHTLHITGEYTKSENDANQKGTHASPRLHLRRGHIRRLSDGRRVWVSSCVVGDKSNGISLHDYCVNAA
jgi:hypothetical protein